jgi:hypothetical protein
MKNARAKEHSRRCQDVDSSINKSNTDTCNPSKNAFNEKEEPCH